MIFIFNYQLLYNYIQSFTAKHDNVIVFTSNNNSNKHNYFPRKFQSFLPPFLEGEDLPLSVPKVLEVFITPPF